MDNFIELLKAQINGQFYVAHKRKYLQYRNVIVYRIFN